MAANKKGFNVNELLSILKVFPFYLANLSKIAFSIRL